MTKEIIFLVEESLGGGYEAKALGESIFTEADTIEALRESVTDAVRCHFDEVNCPKIVRLHFVKEEGRAQLVKEIQEANQEFLKGQAVPTTVENLVKDISLGESYHGQL